MSGHVIPWPAFWLLQWWLECIQLLPQLKHFFFFLCKLHHIWAIVGCHDSSSRLLDIAATASRPSVAIKHLINTPRKLSIMWHECCCHCIITFIQYPYSCQSCSESWLLPGLELYLLLHHDHSLLTPMTSFPTLHLTHLNHEVPTSIHHIRT